MSIAGTTNVIYRQENLRPRGEVWHDGSWWHTKKDK